MSKMLELKEIENQDFNCLIDLCFEVSSHFTLTKKNGALSSKEKTTYIAFLKEMEPYLIEKKIVEHWFCYYVPSGFNLKVYVYEASLKANSVLKKYYSKIFLEGCKYPEDLCFFHEKKLLLGTVSHEKICYLYPIDKAMESRFQQLGLWKEKKYLQEEHITLVL